MKSPLRYPGGKSRAVKIINQYIPSGISNLVSPFMGGGSVEIDQAIKGVRVKGYDAFKPLVCFWHYQLTAPQALYDEVKKYMPMDREQFVTLQKSNPEMECGIEQAATFYVLNRCSFSGSTMSGGMSVGHPRFNESNMQTILKFNVPTLTVENTDFRESIISNPNDFMYLDPPYLLEGDANKLYGVKGSTHKNFGHEDLFDLLKDRDNWIMSYNSGTEIIEMYEGFPTSFPSWQYGMSKDKASKEMLIGSKNLKSLFESSNQQNT